MSANNEAPEAIEFSLTFGRCDYRREVFWKRFRGRGEAIYLVASAYSMATLLFVLASLPETLLLGETMEIPGEVVVLLLGFQTAIVLLVPLAMLRLDLPRPVEPGKRKVEQWNVKISADAIQVVTEDCRIERSLRGIYKLEEVGDALVIRFDNDTVSIPMSSAPKPVQDHVKTLLRWAIAEGDRPVITGDLSAGGAGRGE